MLKGEGGHKSSRKSKCPLPPFKKNTLLAIGMIFLIAQSDLFWAEVRDHPTCILMFWWVSINS